jgi:hypothetical protein
MLLLDYCLQSLVLRVKRKKLTVFVAAEPTDTVLEVKHKLHDMLGQVRCHAQACCVSLWCWQQACVGVLWGW